MITTTPWRLEPLEQRCHKIFDNIKKKYRKSISLNGLCQFPGGNTAIFFGGGSKISCDQDFD